MTFKAQILNMYGLGVGTNFPHRTFTFSRSKIFLNEQQQKIKYSVAPSNKCFVGHKTKYTLTQAYDDNDKLSFQINFGQDCKAFLKVNWLNKQKLKFIHNLFKLPGWLKWFLEKIIDNIIKVAVVAISGYIGYLWGQNNAETNTISKPQNTTQQYDTIAEPKSEVRKATHNDSGNSYNKDTSHQTYKDNLKIKNNDTPK